MEYINLKNSDLKVSRLCMGGCPMGGYGWGDTDDKNLVDSVHSAIDCGINFFDTADTYGLGKSEELLGNALNGRRDKAIVSTKFGVRIENGETWYDNKPEWIRKSLEGSLKRLNTDYIDLYQIHYRDTSTKLDDVIATLEGLKKEGYIRYFGLSNIKYSDIDEFSPYMNSFVSFQNEYSLANRKNEEDIIFISDLLNLTPMTWGSLGQGILTGKYDINSSFGKNDRRSREIYVNFHGEKLKKNLEIVNFMREISEETGRRLPAIAIRFILDYFKDSVVLAGVKNPKQLFSNVESMGWNLNQKQINDLLEMSKEV